MGMDLIYFEAGSGAPDPVPLEMVAAVKGKVRIPVIVGGGIRSAEQAEALRKAGADVIVTGTLVEGQGFAQSLEGVIRAVKG
jgi:phosphoglycerol geranylgeranyltransferase